MLFFNLLVKFGWFKVIYLVFMFRCYIDIMIEVYRFVGMDQMIEILEYKKRYMWCFEVKL